MFFLYSYSWFEKVDNAPQLRIGGTLHDKVSSSIHVSNVWVHLESLRWISLNLYVQLVRICSITTCTFSRQSTILGRQTVPDYQTGVYVSDFTCRLDWWVETALSTSTKRQLSGYGPCIGPCQSGQVIVNADADGSQHKLSGRLLTSS